MNSPITPSDPSDFSRVTVAVRVKPVSEQEGDLQGPNQICVFPQDKNLKTVVIEGENKTLNFSYDFIHWSNTDSRVQPATQEEIYNDLGQPVVRDALQGFNVSIFAYGQTGSGKTYTMMGPSLEASGDASLRGLIPRIGQALFEETAGANEERLMPPTLGDGSQGDILQGLVSSHHFVVSYVEIYLEKVQDLLVRVKGMGQSLKIREHPKTGPYVDGVTMVPVNSYDEVEQLIQLGSSNRMVASTCMNSASSRSHAVFTIHYTKRVQDPDSGTVMDNTCKINLVDLAGSENANSAGTTGERLKEGSYINKSLLTLGMVIKALADKQLSRRGSFGSKTMVPYRDSVLTFLLRDSLGGNSRTTMIATIRPHLAFVEETLSTLRYADRAKSIVNYATVNEDPMTKKLRLLQEQVDKLVKELGECKERESAKNSQIEEMTTQLEAAKRGERVATPITPTPIIRSFLNLASGVSEHTESGQNSSPRGCVASPFHPPHSPHLPFLSSIHSHSPRATPRSPSPRSPLFALRSTPSRPSSPTVKEQPRTESPPHRPPSPSPSQPPPALGEEDPYLAAPSPPLSPLDSSIETESCPPTFRTCNEMEDTQIFTLTHDVADSSSSSPATTHDHSPSSSRPTSPCQAITELEGDVPAMVVSDAAKPSALPVADEDPGETQELVTPHLTDTIFAFLAKEEEEEEGHQQEQEPSPKDSAEYPPLSPAFHTVSPARTFRESDSVLGSTTPVGITMQGYLIKKGQYRYSSYRRRFFVLQGNVLLWYTKFHDPKSIRGALKLRSCHVEVATAEAEKGYPFAFRILPRYGPREECILQASSEEEQFKWIESIQQASLVEDDPQLEQELEESLGKLLSGCNIL